MVLRMLYPVLNSLKSLVTKSTQPFVASIADANLAMPEPDDSYQELSAARLGMTLYQVYETLDTDTACTPIASARGNAPFKLVSENNPYTLSYSSDETFFIRKHLTNLAFLGALLFANTALSQSVYDFRLSGVLSGNNTNSTPVYIWSEDHVVRFVYEDRNCGGRLFPAYKFEENLLEQSSAQMIETVDYGFDNCGLGSLVILSPSTDEAWTFERHQKFSPFPELSGTVKTKDVSPTIDVPPVVPTPLGTVMADSLSGLALAEGDSMRGIGPTSLVLDVRAGSAAANAGIVVGDIILSVMNGAGSAVSHVEAIRDQYEKGRIVDLWLQNAEGDRRMTEVILPDKLNETPSTNSELSSEWLRESEIMELLARRKFNDDRSALDQLAALAGALGIAEHEISKAIAAGRLNPNLEDLKSAYFELPGASCEKLFQESAQSFIDLGKEEFARNRLKTYRSQPHVWCPYLMYSIDEARVSAWNERFGPLVRPMVDPTVVAYFDSNSMRRKDYAQLRCDFTYSLKRAFPERNVIVDCGSLKPKILNNLALRQMSAARRDDVFGPAGNAMSRRIRLFADGAFEALEKQAIIDMGRAPTGLTSLIGRYNPGDPKPTYMPLISSYASARLRALGSCGDPLTRLTLSVTNVQKTTTLSGIEIGRQDMSYDHDFEALDAFAPVIIDNDWLAQPGAPGWGKIAKRFSVIFENLECKSEERKRLEKNMLAYMQGKPPIYTR